VDLGQIGAFAGGVMAIAAPGIAWVRGMIRKRDHKIELLETAIEAKDAANAELRLQVSELKVTAQIQERFFSQLPPSPSPRRRSGGTT
jgi:hypothetical protein